LILSKSHDRRGPLCKDPKFALSDAEDYGLAIRALNTIFHRDRRRLRKRQVAGEVPRHAVPKLDRKWPDRARIMIGIIIHKSILWQVTKDVDVRGSFSPFWGSYRLFKFKDETARRATPGRICFGSQRQTSLWTFVRKSVRRPGVVCSPFSADAPRILHRDQPNLEPTNFLIVIRAPVFRPRKSTPSSRATQDGSEANA